MAAKYTRLLRSIWRDPDFTALPGASQRLYLLLISQPDISACGVLPLLVGRWANLAPDTDADSVQRDLEHLTEAPQQGASEPLVVVDPGTLELWVRGYMKVDELYVSPNGRKAIDAALEAVSSPLLRVRVGRAYRALTEGAPEAPQQGDTPPQQPAALSLSKSTTSSRSPHPDAQVPDGFNEIIDCMIGLRLRSEKGINNPARYAKALKRDLPDEHRETIDRLLAQFPGAPTSSIAAAALSGDTRQLASYAQRPA